MNATDLRTEMREGSDRSDAGLLRRAAASLARYKADEFRILRELVRPKATPQRAG
jgi:hypothetical protein